MVAAGATLLSVAALSSCVLGIFPGTPRPGRLVWRLGSSSNNALPGNASTTGSTSASAVLESATVVTQTTDRSSASATASSSSSSSSSSTGMPSTSDEKPCLTCSASLSSAAPLPPPGTPSSPSAPVSLPANSSTGSVSMSSTATETHYTVNLPATPAAGGGVPAGAAPNTRKGPPPIPTRAPAATVKTMTTSVDFGRPQKPADATTMRVTDIAWPPAGDNYPASNLPSDLFKSWSATRGHADFQWDDVSSAIDDIDNINTWQRVTLTGGRLTLSVWETRKICEASDLAKPSTVYSITHTSTITWTGNPKDYTPPYPPITTPAPCIRVDTEQRAGPQRLTLSRCTSTGTLDKYKTCEMTTIYDVSDRPKVTASGYMSMTQPAAITFITTDKNPAVVFPHMETPDYGYGVTTRLNVKNPPSGAQETPAAVSNNDPGTANNGGGSGSGGGGGSSGGDGRGNRPLGPPVTVSVRPGTVVINDQTFTDSPVMRTQTVRVGAELFTIEPTRVVGAGATVVRPGTGAGVTPAPSAAFPPQTTTLGGVPLVVSGRQAVIGGTTFSLDAPATTKVVGDRIVSIGPGGIAVATGASDPTPARLTPPPVPGSQQQQQPEVVVAGGELVTAVGQSVLVVRSTTITYGPAMSATTIDVNGEPLVVGPGGITMRSSVLGGPNARPGETQFEIVGGATLTQLAPSLVVIKGSTYTVGPGASSTTVVVGHETVTIGPSGVAVSSLSFYYPLGPGSVTTITPAATPAAATADPTGPGNASGGGEGGDGGDKKQEDAAAGLRPAGLALNMLVSSAAVLLTLWWI